MTVNTQFMTALGLALAAVAASAQPGPSPGVSGSSMPRGESFVALDANGDGALSRAELARYPELQRSFEQMDRDKDGTLSMLEYSSSTRGATGIRREPGTAASAATPRSPSQSIPGGIYP